MVSFFFPFCPRRFRLKKEEGNPCCLGAPHFPAKRAGGFLSGTEGIFQVLGDPSSFSFFGAGLSAPVPTSLSRKRLLSPPPVYNPQHFFFLSVDPPFQHSPSVPLPLTLRTLHFFSCHLFVSDRPRPFMCWWLFSATRRRLSWQKWRTPPSLLLPISQSSYFLMQKTDGPKLLPFFLLALSERPLFSFREGIKSPSL